MSTVDDGPDGGHAGREIDGPDGGHAGREI